MGELERLLWPVSAGPGDHWLSMLVTDDSYVDLAIVGGLWVCYKLYNSLFTKTTCLGTPRAGPRLLVSHCEIMYWEFAMKCTMV